jgi:hypothetical protein
MMKSTAGVFVVTSSCSPSGDMLGGCERGCGNDRAQAGVGFDSLSIQFEGKKEANPHYAHASHLFGRPHQIHQIRQISTLANQRSCLLPVSTTTMPSPFQFLRRVYRCGRHLGAERDEEASTSKEESLQVYIPSPKQATAVYFTQYPNQWAKIRLAYMD